MDFRSFPGRACVYLLCCNLDSTENRCKKLPAILPEKIGMTAGGVLDITKLNWVAGDVRVE